MPETATLLRGIFEGLSLTRAVLSKPRSRELPRKVTVDPVELRGETAYRFTTQLADRATHENLTADSARERLGTLLTDYGQVRVVDYLRRLYREPGFKQSFDVLAVHAYAPDTPAVGRLLDRTRKVAVENGDAGRPMWVTEMGWGTTSPRLATPTSPAQQAVRMRQSFDMMIGCRGRWNLERAYWFAYKDLAAQPGQPDLSANHTGLFDLAGRPKPAWGTLQRYRGGAGVPGAANCRLGDARAPQTRIKARKRFNGVHRARMRLVASERGARFQCRLVRAVKKRSARSARRWRKCRGSYRTPRLKPGRYHLDVRAKDKAGNVDRTPARARVRLKRGQRVTVTVRVLRATRVR